MSKTEIGIGTALVAVASGFVSAWIAYDLGRGHGWWAHVEHLRTNYPERYEAAGDDVKPRPPPKEAEPNEDAKRVAALLARMPKDARAFRYTKEVRVGGLTVGVTGAFKLYVTVKVHHGGVENVSIADEWDRPSRNLVEDALTARLAEWEAEDRAAELREATEALRKLDPR